MQVESEGWPKKAGTGNENYEEMRIMRKWRNEDTRKWEHVCRLGRMTGSLTCETTVYSTECTVGWRGKEGREVMAESSSSEGAV